MLSKSRTRLFGVIYGAIAAICYGMNPLFTLPLYHRGMDVNSVLFYRYSVALIILLIWLKFFKKIPLKINRAEIMPLIFMGLAFSLSSLALFKSYTYMDAGIASTILFIYPVMVAMIMILFFKEKIKISVISSIILTIFGIILLYNGKPDEKLSNIGVIMVLLSALSYAIYIVGTKKIRAISRFNAAKLTFYIMLFGSIVFIYNLNFLKNLSPIKSTFQVLDIFALAFFPTVVSLVALSKSIKLAGPTTAAILGALEPVSAVFFGVCIFSEELSLRIVLGIITILFAVSIIIKK